jgi:para-nitrobenzyl esterase
MYMGVSMKTSSFIWLRHAAWFGAFTLAVSGPLVGQSKKTDSVDTVTIDTGKLRGSVVEDGVRAYLGIPFAAPPVGDLRWHEPMPAKPWTGVYDATQPKPTCAQLRGIFEPESTYAVGAQEDCLYLNVWTPPAAKRSDKLPVLVYIYGGGFSTGSINIPAYSGVPIARKGVLRVNLAYRVGIFGYFAHPELTRESAHNASGDWGSLDQIAGLKWVQRNIAAFGGDPANVTVVGQSAGSESIYQLQASPLAKGLFARINAWSGADLAPGGQIPRSLSEGEATGVRFQGMLHAASLAEMRAIPMEQVLAALAPPAGAPGGAGGPNAIQTRPIVDGYFLPDEPQKIFQAGRQADVPLYTSSTQLDLGSLMDFYKVKTVDDLQRLAATTFGDADGEFLKLFPAANDDEARKMALIVTGDTGFGVANRDWARDQAHYGKAPVWMAQWAHTPPPNSGAPAGAFGRGPAHASDIPYWLGTLSYNHQKSWTDLDDQLSAKMEDTLVAFAKTGDPNTHDVTVPRYDPAQEQRVVFGDSVSTDKLNTAQIEFLRAHAPKRGAPPVAPASVPANAGVAPR